MANPRKDKKKRKIRTCWNVIVVYLEKNTIKKNRVKNSLKDKRKEKRNSTFQFIIPGSVIAHNS